jgi:GT2 family glycosyltransferase
LDETRPPVSVVVPFLGGRREAEAVTRAFAALRLAPGDELIVVDNNERPLDATAWAGTRVVHAAAERSSYHARNVGARRATNDWILFVDSDCRPDPGLIDAYLGTPAPERCGALTGVVVADQGQRALAARYARARGFLNGAGAEQGEVWALGGNLMVRRTAFELVGGFEEGIRSGGDVDLAWKLVDAGWALEPRAPAVVEHAHSERVLGFLRIVARYGAGARWLNERHPGFAPRWPLPKQLALAGLESLRLAARDREQAAFRALDGLALVAHNVGYRSSNSATGREPQRMA